MDKAELKELGTCGFNRVQQAIEAGDKEKALSLLEEIARGVESLVNVRTSQIDLLLTYIADKLGDEANAVNQRWKARHAYEYPDSFGPL